LCAGSIDEVVDSYGGHHDSVSAKRDPVVPGVQLVSLEANGSGLRSGGGIMQPNATLEASSRDLSGESLKVFEVGLDGDNKSLFANPASEFQRKKPNVSSDIDDHGSRRDKIFQPAYRSRLDRGFVDRVSRKERAVR